MYNIDLTILICVHSSNEVYDSLLISALKSLEKQTYKNFKTMIVMDDCWDKTETIIKKENLNLNLEIIQKINKTGLHDVKNYGLSKINSDYVAYLDGDDLYVETKIEKQIEYIVKNPDVDFVSTQGFILNRMNKDSDFVEDDYPLGIYDTHDKIKERIFLENMFYHGSFLIRKKCLDELGGYNRCSGCEDWDLWKKAILKGYKFYQIPERLYIYRIGTSQPRK